MKKCQFCDRDIKDNARKCPHCLSFQDNENERKKRFDTASLIISYIGVIAVVFTITIGIFGYFGFKSFWDLKNHSEEILDNTNKKILEFDQKIENLTKDFTKANIAINDLLIKRFNDRYYELLDRLVLDKLEETELIMREIVQIAEEAAKILLLSGDSRTIVIQIGIITDALKSYKEKNYKKTVELVINLEEDNIYKHRILTASYLHLYYNTKDNDKEAKRNLEKLLESSEKYNKIASSLNKKAIIGKINRANALMMRNQPGDINEALKLLDVAMIEFPNRPALYYNKSVACMIARDIEEALKSLERAYELGLFQKNEMKKKFKNEFKELVDSDDDKIKRLVHKILSSR